MYLFYYPKISLSEQFCLPTISDMEGSTVVCNEVMIFHKPYVCIVSRVCKSLFSR
jgi:hypothetical protein